MRKIIKLSMILGLSTPLLIFNTSAWISQFHDYKALQTILWSFSAERKAQFLTQFHAAKMQFDAVVEKNQAYLSTDVVQVNEENEVSFATNNIVNNKFIPVVAVDLDETFLDNTPAIVFDYFNNNGSFSQENWHKWFLKQTNFKDQIYPGVLSFAEYVWKNGGMVLFVSNRKSGDHQPFGDEAKVTRETLIENNYPKSFLDSYVWWLKGVSKYSESSSDWKNLESKENRFNYLNDSQTKLKSRTMQELGIKDGWNDVGQQVSDLPIHIIMKIGDNLNDFNDNLTKYHDQASTNLRNVYLENKDISETFGATGREIWFTKENNVCIQNYWTNGDQEKIDQIFLNKGYVSEIRAVTGLLWEVSYLQIGANPLYGDWFDRLVKENGSSWQQLEQIIKEYYKKYFGS